MQQPDFDKYELIPAIVQDAQTRKVLMLGYMNHQAYQKTLETRLVTFYSRSKNRLWTKGETSGHYLKLMDIKTDCDNDTLLVYVLPDGPVCHTGNDTCWNEKNTSAYFLNELQYLIRDRKLNPKENSYTNRLFHAGISQIALKVGEEAIETIVEAMKKDKIRLIEESADLLYHLLVLLEASDCSLDDVTDVLKKRHHNLFHKKNV
jgi:phosphoribosyl-ATP pyrophosphohydrolase/phosphoribosyl-AMP cyclohydrolase